MQTIYKAHPNSTPLPSLPPTPPFLYVCRTGRSMPLPHRCAPPLSPPLLLSQRQIRGGGGGGPSPAPSPSNPTPPPPTAPLPPPPPTAPPPPPSCDGSGRPATSSGYTSLSCAPLFLLICATPSAIPYRSSTGRQRRRPQHLRPAGGGAVEAPWWPLSHGTVASLSLDTISGPPPHPFLWSDLELGGGAV
jgi:hypothetical protein